VSAIPFLLLAGGLSLLGTLIVWLVHRKPESVERDVSNFADRMAALSPGMRSVRSVRPPPAPPDVPPHPEHPRDPSRT